MPKLPPDEVNKLNEDARLLYPRMAMGTDYEHWLPLAINCFVEVAAKFGLKEIDRNATTITFNRPGGHYVFCHIKADKYPANYEYYGLGFYTEESPAIPTWDDVKVPT